MSSKSTTRSMLALPPETKRPASKAAPTGTSNPQSHHYRRVRCPLTPWHDDSKWHASLYPLHCVRKHRHRCLKGMREPLLGERGIWMPEDRSDDASQTLDPRHLLIDWANRQDSWVRRLVGHVITSQRPFSDEQTTEFFELFLAEKGFHGSSSDIEPELPYPRAGSAQSDPLRLLSLSKVSGVNALSPGATIDFSQGLTILYGENGTGKTGYARILKRISAVQYPEEILPDINSTDAQTPAATIDYELGDVPASVEWRNEVGVSPFTRMSVFDSPISQRTGRREPRVRVHTSGDFPVQLRVFWDPSNPRTGISNAKLDGGVQPVYSGF